LTNRVIWQKASLLSKSIIYLFIFLIAFPLFGQTYDSDYSQNNYTFKSAVKQYNTGNYEDADNILNNISFSEKEYFAEEIALLSMRVKYRLNDFISSKEIGKSLLLDHPNSEYETDALITFGDIFIAEGLYDAAFRTYIKSFKNNNYESFKKNIVKRIYLSLQMGISPSIPEELLAIEIEQNLIQILLLAKVHTELQAGQPIKAANTFSKIDVKDLSTINRDYYSNLENKLYSSTRGRAFIGVVLPLTGKDSDIGKEFLEGLKYAEANNFLNDIELSLIVYDNTGNVLNTAKAFQALNKNPNVAAIIGPISADNAVIAGSITGASGVPLLLPTASINGLSEISDNIFLMNSDLKTRGELAGQFIAETLEAENIAVLAPADKFGKSLVDAFTNKLKTYDKVSLITEWYSGIPMNLQRQFKSIRAKAWELSETADSLELKDTTIDFLFAEDILDADTLEVEMTAEDSSDVILNTIDAIYMPIHAGHLDYVGAQFPAYNLDAVVIGNDNWADLEVLRKEIIGPHLDGMLVISNYSNHQIDALNTNFDIKHTDYFYQAFDCYNLLAKSITEANANNKPLTQILSNVDDFRGIFGTYNFADDNNNVNSTLNILQFDGFYFDEYIDQNQSFEY